MDFTLSNFSNSEIDKILVLTENNLSAVFNHTKQGYVWINNTRTGFLRIAMNEKLIESVKFNTDIANIEAHYSIIEDSKPEIIVVAPSFFLYSFDFRKAIEDHEESGADAGTVVKTELPNFKNRCCQFRIHDLNFSDHDEYRENKVTQT